MIMLLALMNQVVPTRTQDVFWPSKIEWEEHFVVRQDGSVLAFLILSLLVNATSRSDIHDLTLRIHSAQTPSVFLFPSNRSYSEIAGITVMEYSAPFATLLRNDYLITMSFNAGILDFWRYSIGLLIILPSQAEVRTPWLYGETQVVFDHTLWLESPGSGPVPWGQLSSIVEGQRFESSFPYVTVTCQRELRLDSATPPIDTRNDSLFYAQGIYSEHKDKTVRVIPTYVVGSLIASGQINLSNMTSELDMFPPDDQLTKLWQLYITPGKQYQTIGWFKPVSHVSVIIRNPQNEIVFQNLMFFLAIVAVLLGIAGLVVNDRKKRSEDHRKRTRRNEIRKLLEVFRKARFDTSRDRLRTADLTYVFTQREIIKVRQFLREKGSKLEPELSRNLNDHLKDIVKLTNGYFASNKDKEIHRDVVHLETELQKLRRK
jgi:hypothetical protein